MGIKTNSAFRPAVAPGTRCSLADALFTSTQQRVLGLLFGQPSRTFYLAEIIALANSGTGAVQRELARLVSSELVIMRVIGRQKHYQANAGSPIYAELCAIANKTMAPAEPLRAALEHVSNGIRAAFVYGSVAKKQDTASSDIDLMIISDTVTYADVFGALDDLGQVLGRQVNPTIYSRSELTERLARQDSFITRAMQQPKIWIMGDAHALES